jgi:electron transfer flavoprotein beta subunit
VINPFDAHAVEAALRIRDATGDGKITVLSVGPASARDAVKHGLAISADDGVLIDDIALADADSFVTSRAGDRHVQDRRV